ncbi:MAG: hypothetical protein JO147_13650, partial [Actinobacteria bacterium]|nr:hypothetical protein [Actinomycetota bacterium]
GISVPGPSGWDAAASRRPGIRYLYADGDDPDDLAAAASDAVETTRETRRPALLHVRTVRYLGHAGTDVESGYRRSAEIEADLDRDPLLALARRISGPDLASRYDEIATTVRGLADELQDAVRLDSAFEIAEPLRAPEAAELAAGNPFVAGSGERERVFAGRLPERSGPLTLAQSINATLSDALAAHPELFVFGEDVGRKGGVYGVTRGLQQRFRLARVFDTLLDEQSILGLALGLGVSGLLPVPEIQYLAYLHNAEDQLRGEAASLRFFSGGAFTNPMVVRIAGLAYQRGFGGHFHNDNSLAVLRDIPGLLIAVPSRPEDAAPLLRTCLQAALHNGSVCAFIEPIALYHERDLHQPGDRGWLGDYSSFTSEPLLGRGRTHGSGEDLTIITFGNGLRMSLRVAARLAADGIDARVLDLRWINPLPVEDIVREAAATGRVLVADETRHSGGVGEGIVAALVEHGFTGSIARVAAADSFIPLGEAAYAVLLSEEDIDRAARKLAERG